MTWAPLYAAVGDIRTYMRAGSDTGDDAAVYTPALTAASRLIDSFCGRQFGVVTSEARYYTALYHKTRQKYIIPVDDTQATVTLAVDLDGAGTYGTAVTDFIRLPINAGAKGKPYTELQLGSAAGITTTPERYKATSTWGWTAVPAAITAATLLQASRIAKRRDSPFGIAGSPDLGNEVRLLAKLDPDVAVMITPYRRLW